MRPSLTGSRRSEFRRPFHRPRVVLDPGHGTRDPHNRRRHGGGRGGLVRRPLGRPFRHPRDAAQGRHLRPQDGRLGRDGLLQLLPLGRRRKKRRRPSSLGDAGGGLTGDGDGGAPSSARWWRPGRRPGCLLARCDGGDHVQSADFRSRGRGRLAACGGKLDRGHRPAYFWLTGRIHSGRDGRRGARFLRRHRAHRPC
jgi:hypothetical protein